MMSHNAATPDMTKRTAAAFALFCVTLSGCKEAPLKYSSEDDGRTVSPPERAPMERCYGIARAGETDGLTGAEKKGADGPGTSSVDWQGNGWKYVRRGSCESYGGENGPPLPGNRRGSLHPLERDMPDGL